MQPNSSMPNYLSYNYATRPASSGLALPVSHGPTNTWITIPWDVDNYDPTSAELTEGQHTNKGWTMLTGPCTYIITGWVRLMDMEAACSTHLILREAERINGENVIKSTLEATEWFVGENETHSDGSFSNTHLHGTWIGVLSANRRLQMCVDYWNAGHQGKIVGGSARILYWPGVPWTDPEPDEPPVDPATA